MKLNLRHIFISGVVLSGVALSNALIWKEIEAPEEVIEYTLKKKTARGPASLGRSGPRTMRGPQKRPPSFEPVMVDSSAPSAPSEESAADDRQGATVTSVPTALASLPREKVFRAQRPTERSEAAPTSSKARSGTSASFVGGPAKPSAKASSEVSTTETTATSSSSGPESVSFTVSSIALNEGKIVLTGSNLENVRSIRIEGTGISGELVKVSSTATEYVAIGLSALQTAIGATFNVLVADAYAQSTFPVEVVLEDGTITADKLAPLTSSEDGYVLKWDGSAGEWAAVSPLHHSVTQTDVLSGSTTLSGTSTELTVSPSSDETFVAWPGPEHIAGKRYAHIPTTNANDVQTMIAGVDYAWNEGTGAVNNLKGSILGAYNTSAGTVNDISGALIWAETDAGTVDDLTSIDAWNGAYGGTVDSQIGISSTLSNSGATVNTRINLYLWSDSNATNEWAIYQDGNERNYFAGKIGIGTSNPTYQLQLSTNSAAKPGSTAWTIPSDERLKDVSGPFGPGLRELTQLDVVKYRYKKDNPLGLPSNEEFVGLRAQNAKKAVPESVKKDAKGYLHLDSDPIMWTMVNAIKELAEKRESVKREIASVKASHQEEIEELKAENSRLKQENAVILKRLEKIEKQLGGR